MTTGEGIYPREITFHYPTGQAHSASGAREFRRAGRVWRGHRRFFMDAGIQVKILLLSRALDIMME